MDSAYRASPFGLSTSAASAGQQCDAQIAQFARQVERRCAVQAPVEEPVDAPRPTRTAPPSRNTSTQPACRLAHSDGDQRQANQPAPARIHQVAPQQPDHGRREQQVEHLHADAHHRAGQRPGPRSARRCGWPSRSAARAGQWPATGSRRPAPSSRRTGRTARSGPTGRGRCRAPGGRSRPSPGWSTAGQARRCSTGRCSGPRPVRRTSSPARMCHHTSPSISGQVARGSTAATKKPTTAAVAAATPAASTRAAGAIAAPARLLVDMPRSLCRAGCVWSPPPKYCRTGRCRVLASGPMRIAGAYAVVAVILAATFAAGILTGDFRAIERSDYMTYHVAARIVLDGDGECLYEVECQSPRAAGADRRGRRRSSGARCRTTRRPGSPRW